MGEKKCNYCDTEEGLEYHHIIPRSLGGTDEPNNLLLVCNVHHAILHEMRSRRNISMLIQEGLQKRRQQGLPFGNPNKADRIGTDGKVVLGYVSAMAKARKSYSTMADEFAEKVYPTIARMRLDGLSLNAIARDFNDKAIPTSRGGAWTARTVLNIVERQEPTQASITENRQRAGVARTVSGTSVNPANRNPLIQESLKRFLAGNR